MIEGLNSDFSFSKTGYPTNTTQLFTYNFKEEEMDP